MEERFIPYNPITKINANSVLVLAAHPDDEVFGCGGAIKKHVEAGHPIKVIVVTDGSCGISSKDHNCPTFSIRKDECLKAAKILGYGTPIFWDIPDRALCFEESLVKKIIEAIEETKADLIYAPSPYEIHPDHRNLCRSVLEAMRRLDRDIMLAMYEVGAPFRPNTLLDITDVWAYKEKAMCSFKSQLERQPYHHQISGLNQYRTYTLPKTVSYSEAYFTIHSRDIWNGWGRLTEQLSFEHPLHPSQNLHPLEDRERRKYGKKVSILIRSLGRSTLKDAIRSIEQQTYPNIEIVVVNAKGQGHCDIASYSSRFELCFIDSPSPLSRTQAGNIALESAKGDFLMFLDDDDYLFPDHVHTLIEALDKEPAHLLAYTKVMCVGAHGESLEKVIGHEFDPVLLLAGNYIPIHAALFSKALVEAGVRMDDDFDLYEDWDLWLQAAQYTDFVFVPKVTACYRLGEGSGGGLSPTHSKRKEAAKKIFKKWEFLWTKEKLDYIIERLGEKNIDPNILNEANSSLKSCTISAKDKENQTPRIAVLLHIYYEDLWPEIRDFLKNIPFKFQLYTTLCGPNSSDLSQQVRSAFPKAEIHEVENRGRDILPFLGLLPKLIEIGYDCALKLHTKKSSHSMRGDQWRRQLLKSIVGSKERVRDVIRRFREDETLGILGPASHFISCSEFLDSNHERVLKLAQLIHPNSVNEDWHFFAGSMFWFRPTAMLPLITLGLKDEDFEPEQGQIEGTMAHAIERVFPVAVIAAGYKVGLIKDEEQYDHTFSYPFAPKSALYLLKEKNRLKEQVRQAEKAKEEAERLAFKHLNDLNQLQDTVTSLQQEISKIEALALDRLSEISRLDTQTKELQSALKKAEELALARLNYVKQLERGLKDAQDIAIKRLEKINELERRVLYQDQQIHTFQNKISEYEELVSALRKRLERIEHHWLWRNAQKVKNTWDRIFGKK